MNLISEEWIIIDGNKVTLHTKCAGDVGYIKELQYIKMQCIIDRMVSL